MASGGKTLKVTILGDAKSAQGAFKNLESSAGGLSGKLGSLFSVAGGMAIFNVGASAVRELSGALKGAISDANFAETAQAQLTQVLKSTGGVAGVTAQQVNALADGFEKTTVFGNDQTVMGENLLLTFTNIGKNVFPQATSTMLDMSQALGQDMKSSAVQLGKALNDPTKGITALSRVGVSFTQQQKDQIAAMQQAGDVAGAQGVILAELQREFGGAAEAAGSTFSGQLAILKNELSDVGKNIVLKVLPPLTKLATEAMPSVLSAMTWATDGATRMINALSGPATSAFQTVSGIVTGTLIPAFTRVSDVVLGLIPTFQQFLGFVTDHWKDIATVIAPTISILDRLATAIGNDGLIGGLRQLPSILGDAAGSFQTVLGPIVDGILHLFESIDWGAVGQTLLRGLSSAFTTLTGAASGALGLGASLLSMLTSAFQSIDWGSVGQTILAGLGTAFAALSTGAGMAVNFGQQIYTMILTQVTATDWSGIASAITSGLGSALNSATSAISGAGSQGGIIGKLFGDAATIIGQLQPLFDGIMAGIQPIIDNLQNSFAPVMAQLQLSWQQLQPTIQGLMPTLEALGVIVGTTLVVALGLLLAALGGLTGMMTGVLPGAIQAATGVLQIFGGAVEVASSLIAGVIKVIIDLLQGDWMGAWNDAKAAVQGMADGITQIISGLGNVVSGLISGMVGAVNGLISGFVDTIIGYFQGLYDSLVGHSIIPDMINGIIEAFAGMPGQILGIVSGLVSSVIGQFSDLATQMIAKGGEIISNLASGITGAIGGVQTAIGSVKGAVTGAFSDAAGWLLNAGADIINGLANGIGNAVGTAAAAARNAASAVKNAVTGFLGIQSPSTVMIEIGQQVIAGLALGMSNTDALAKAADSTSSQLVNAMITGITNGVSSDEMVPRLTKALLPSLLAAQQAAANALDLAKVSGASDDDLAKLQAKLDAATSLIQRWQEFNQQTIDQFTKEATDAALAQQSQDDLVSSWSNTFQNFGSILDGTLIPQLKDKLSGLTEQLKIALADHVPQSIIDGIQTSIATVTQQIQQAGQVVQTAADAGIIQPVKALSDAAVDQIKKTMGELKDGGASLMDSIVSGVESGQIKLNQAMQLIPDSALPKLKEVIDTLKDKLAAALIAGTDPGPIQANIDTLTKLFAALSSAAGQSADAVAQVAVAIGDFVAGKGYKTAYGYTNVKPGSSSSSGGSGGSGGGGGGAASSGLPNGTMPWVQKYYDTYYSPDELTYTTRNGEAITTVKATPEQLQARQNNPNTFASHANQQGGNTTIHGDIYVTQPQSTSLDDLLRGVVPA